MTIGIWKRSTIVLIDVDLHPGERDFFFGNADNLLIDIDSRDLGLWYELLRQQRQSGSACAKIEHPPASCDPSLENERRPELPFRHCQPDKSVEGRRQPIVF